MIKKMIYILAIAALTLCGCKTDGAEINPSAESGALCEVYFVDNAGQTIKSEIVGYAGTAGIRGFYKNEGYG